MAATEAPAIPEHFLRVTDLDAAGLEALLDLAALMKRRPHGFVDALQGDTVVCFFEKPSTRTRVSFAAAAERLGMLPLVLRPDELQLGRGETIADTARTLSGYAAAIVVRTFAQETVDELAAAARKPVINALTDEHHPCQALADLLTLRERFGSLDGLRVAYVGDGNNVASSLLNAISVLGGTLRLGTPRTHLPAPHVRKRAAELAAKSGAQITWTEDPVEAVRGADFVYTDVWTSMGQESESAQRKALFEPFQLNARLLAHAPDAQILHCLPAHRGEEITDDVLDGPRSIVFDQAENRLHAQKALLELLVG